MFLLNLVRCSMYGHGNASFDLRLENFFSRIDFASLEKSLVDDAW